MNMYVEVVEFNRNMKTKNGSVSKQVNDNIRKKWPVFEVIRWSGVIKKSK